MNLNKIFLIIAILFAQSAFATFLPIANVSKISGSAMANKLPLKVGSEISEGMRIELKNKKDFIEIKYQNGHVVRMMGSTIIVDRLNPKESVLTLVKGVVYNLVNKLTPDETFIIKTRQASMGVRGTKFYVQVSEKDSYLCVCDGVVNVTDKIHTVDVSKNQDLTVSKNSKWNVVGASQNMIQMGNTVFDEMKK
jgi:hypothetical protein